MVDMTFFGHTALVEALPFCPMLFLSEDEPAILFTLLLTKGLIEPKQFVAWPDHPGPGHVGPGKVALTDRGRVYLDLLAAAHSAHPGDGRIPAHKLITRQGWHVTVDECRRLERDLANVTSLDVALVKRRMRERSRMFGQMVTAAGFGLPPEEAWSLLPLQQQVTNLARRVRAFAAQCIPHDGFDVF